MLRDYHKIPSPDPEVIAMVQRGELVPAGDVFETIAQHMMGHYALGRRTFLIDGFPRKIDQRDEVERLVSTQQFVDFCGYLGNIITECVVARKTKNHRKLVIAYRPSIDSDSAGESRSEVII